jgi:serine/threonine protein kinase
MRAGDARSVERFAREARVLADLRHPGIVEYIGHGRTEHGDLYLAMEWLQGEDLGVRLARSELTAADSLRLVTQVAAALAVAHSRRVVHRDLKPSNLFLVDGDSERVKVLDFGVARLLRGADLTGTGEIVGTPEYMAPEQARGDKTIDARADVFALGSVLFRCLTGRSPFVGKSAASVLARLVLENAPRLRQLRPELPPELDDLVARMLAKDPAQRPVDARAVLTELVLLAEPVAEGGRPPTAPPSELTEGERRIVCIVLAGGEAARDAPETLDETVERSPALDATVKTHGASSSTSPTAPRS